MPALHKRREDKGKKASRSHMGEHMGGKARDNSLMKRAQWKEPGKLVWRRFSTQNTSHHFQFHFSQRRREEKMAFRCRVNNTASCENEKKTSKAKLKPNKTRTSE